VISWPAGIRARGEVRHQYHHATDIVPTILECCEIEYPEYVLGYEQTPLPGVSMKYSFDSADAPTTKKVQYYEMLGTRGLWSGGWKVVAERGPMIGTGRYEDDTWQLFHTDEDRSEARDLAGEHPGKVKELVDLWFVEAGKYDVLPLDDRSVAELVAVQPEAMIPPGGVYKYYPGTLEVPEFSAANTRGRSYKILAQVEIADRSVQGVIYAQGARFGGHSLFVKDRKLWYVYNFIGIPPEQQLVSSRELEPGAHVLGMEFVKESVGARHETHGTAKLYIDDQVVAEAQVRTQPGHFALCGEGLSIGRDTGDAVSKEYTPHFPFTGGRILEVEVNVGDDVYLDVERDFAAAMARD
jgi:arylsulfatase